MLRGLQGAHERVSDHGCDPEDLCSGTERLEDVHGNGAVSARQAAAGGPGEEVGQGAGRRSETPREMNLQRAAVYENATIDPGLANVATRAPAGSTVPPKPLLSVAR